MLYLLINLSKVDILPPQGKNLKKQEHLQVIQKLKSHTKKVLEKIELHLFLVKLIQIKNLFNNLIIINYLLIMIIMTLKEKLDLIIIISRAQKIFNISAFNKKSVMQNYLN